MTTRKSRQKKTYTKNKPQYHILLIIVVLFLLVYYLFPTPPCSITDFNQRSVWLSYIDLSKCDFSSKKAFIKDYQEILDKVNEYQCNNIIVHVRAYSDALYPSSIYPHSKIITSYNQLSFDPLEVMIDLTHQRGNTFEAWINPYRVSDSKYTYQMYKHSNKDQMIQYDDYSYIYDPSNQQVRDRIVLGVKEIVENYDVDGIHFDDYFYVDGSHQHTSVKQRQKNVNLLIKDVYQTIKEIDKNIMFGISPQGNYENSINAGCDIKTWLSNEGYIDYLMPQIYWSTDYNSTNLFKQRASKFAYIKRNNHVKLYGGLALYNAGKSYDKDQGWSLYKNNISKQVQILSELDYDGYCLFSYRDFKKGEGIKELDNLIKEHYKNF